MCHCLTHRLVVLFLYTKLAGSITYVGGEARRPGVVRFGMPIEGGGAVDSV